MSLEFNGKGYTTKYELRWVFEPGVGNEGNVVIYPANRPSGEYLAYCKATYDSETQKYTLKGTIQSHIHEDDLKEIKNMVVREIVLPIIFYMVASFGTDGRLPVNVMILFSIITATLINLPMSYSVPAATFRMFEQKLPKRDMMLTLIRHAELSEVSLLARGFPLLENQPLL